MQRVRGAFNNLMKSESYSRFNLPPHAEGERHVEEKMSDDITEDVTQVEGQARPSMSFRQTSLHHNKKTMCYLSLGTLLVFLLGFLIGYASHSNVEPARTEPVAGVKGQTERRTTPVFIPAKDMSLKWSDVKQLLSQKLTSQAFDKTLRDYDVPGRSAGSGGDGRLAARIHEEFTQLNMDPWSDNHYVQLQMPDNDHPNHVIFGSDDFKPEGYLAYSATGKVEGKLVYANYGRLEDLDVVLKKEIELNGSVLLLRKGKISYAEKVVIAASRGASAVLIYPDKQDYKYEGDTALYGHVHLGSGDPYTPGFPSFNHTLFPPTKSSGLPEIPAQTITANMAYTLLQNIGGPQSDASSGFNGGFHMPPYRLGGSEDITVEVNSVLVNTKIRNVFGVIKGFTDPDQYLVLGAQRDAWGRGYARANVGTCVLMELARAISEMVKKDGFRPRRSIVFASWSAGEYGNVGATEWLEAYISSIHKSLFTYISLDGLVMGRGSFTASASPLLYTLIESTMKTMPSPLGSGTVYDMVGKNNWEANVMRPMSMDDPAYPFLAFSGIPSMSFHFTSKNMESYPYYDTNLDNMDHLDYQTNHHSSEITALAAQCAGVMALRLVHDHLINLDVNQYGRMINKAVIPVYMRIKKLQESGQIQNISTNWLVEARGSFLRAVDSINTAITNSDLNNVKTCRRINDRIMTVEHSLLSPYVSPTQTPFRHLLLGRGPHTLASLGRMRDMEQLHVQLALATWTMQGCSYAMVGDIWDIQEQI